MALHNAVMDMKAGRIDVAIVGGVSAIFSPSAAVGYNKLHITCPDSKVKSFDITANGTVRSEGVGLAIIARADLNWPELFFAPMHVYANVITVRANNDGYTPEGVSFPNRELQAALSKKVGRRSGGHVHTCHVPGSHHVMQFQIKNAGRMTNFVSLCLVHVT